MVDGLQYLYDTREGDVLLDKACACSIIDDDGTSNTGIRQCCFTGLV
jgi:hypothetical protein